MTKTENIGFRFYRFRSGAVSELDLFSICCLDRCCTVVVTVFCRGLGLWTHLCKKHWFTTALYRLFTVCCAIDLEVFPRVPFTACLAVCGTACGLCAACCFTTVLLLFYRFPCKGLVTKPKKQLIMFVFVALRY